MAGNISHNLINALGHNFSQLVDQKAVKVTWSAKNALKKTALPDEFKRTMSHIAEQANYINNNSPHRVKIVFDNATVGTGSRLSKGAGVRFKFKTLGVKRDGTGVAANKLKTAETVAINSSEMRNFLDGVSLKLSNYSAFPKAPRAGEKTFKEKISILSNSGGTAPRNVAGTGYAPGTAPVHGPAPHPGASFEPDISAHLGDVEDIFARKAEMKKASRAGNHSSKEELKQLNKDAESRFNSITAWLAQDGARRADTNLKSLEARADQAEAWGIIPKARQAEFERLQDNDDRRGLAAFLSGVERDHMLNRQKALQTEIWGFVQARLRNIEQDKQEIANKFNNFCRHMTTQQKTDAEAWLEAGNHGRLNRLLDSIEAQEKKLASKEHHLKDKLQTSLDAHGLHRYTSGKKAEEVLSFLKLAEQSITKAGKKPIQERSVLLENAQQYIADAEALRTGTRHTAFVPPAHETYGAYGTYTPRHRVSGRYDEMYAWSEDVSDKAYSETSSVRRSKLGSDTESNPSIKEESDSDSVYTEAHSHRSSSNSSDSSSSAAPRRTHRTRHANPITRATSAEKAQWKTQISALKGIITEKHYQTLKEMLRTTKKPSITARKGESGYSRQVANLWYFNHPEKAVKRAYSFAAGHLEKQGAFKTDDIAANVTRYINEGSLDEAATIMQDANAVAKSQANKHKELTSKLEALTDRLEVIASEADHYLTAKSGYRLNPWNEYNVHKAANTLRYTEALDEVRAELDAVKKAKASDGTILRTKQKQRKLKEAEAALAKVEATLKTPKRPAPVAWGDTPYVRWAPIGLGTETHIPIHKRPLFPNTKSQRDAYMAAQLRKQEAAAESARKEAKRLRIQQGLI